MRFNRISAVVFALIAASTAAVAGRVADQSASDVAQALQRKYDGIKDFSADFVHTYQGGVLKKQLTESGQLLIKKPGKMRWDYKSPEQKLFVSDGMKIYSYIPQDKQVIVGSVPPDDRATTPALFLAGKGNLTRDFTVSLVNMPAGMPQGTRALKLVPKTVQPDYDWLVLSVEPETLRLRGLMTTDSQGGTSSFSFTNLKENVGLADKDFAFKIPRGVDVVTDFEPPARSRCLSRVAALLVLSLGGRLAGCATAAAIGRGREAERRQDYDLAVVEYTKAVGCIRTTPTRASGSSAPSSAPRRIISPADAGSRRGKLDQALVEYEVAAELNPTNGDIDNELKTTRNQLREKVAVAREGKTELETLISRARELPPPGLDLPTDVKMPASLVFRDASSRDVFQTIAKFANIGLGFDTAFREAPVTIDLRNASLEDALSSVADQTRTFFRVTAPRTVLVIPDTPAKRREYEEEVVQTFPLSNADLKETMDLLRLVLDARRISPTTATNALTIKDTPEHIAAAARVISAIDKARPEVIIDVELLEVDRSRLQEYGLQLASPGPVSPGLNGSVSVATDQNSSLTLQSLRNLTQSDVLLANLPTLYYRLLKTDTNTRTLANPQLRTSEGTAGAGALRRARAGAGHDVLADRHRRHAPAADHVVQLREHRREHRHHAAHASRRRRDAGAEGRRAEHFGHGLRRAADVRQPRDQHGDPAARRRDEHARRA